MRDFMTIILQIIVTVLRFTVIVVHFILFMFWHLLVALLSSDTSSGSSSTGSNTDTGSSANRIPNRININGDWYYQGGGECGAVEFKDAAGRVKHVVKKPYPVLHSNLYFVYDLNGNKVGEFDTRNT